MKACASFYNGHGYIGSRIYWTHFFGADGRISLKVIIYIGFLISDEDFSHELSGDPDTDISDFAYIGHILWSGWSNFLEILSLISGILYKHLGHELFDICEVYCVTSIEMD